MTQLRHTKECEIVQWKVRGYDRFERLGDQLDLKGETPR